ncbi:MAG TPA: 4-hydroxy-3-methylbut-2-enyl diphosphate reductase [Flavobacteriales bacterium]|nr:4-hydroxy-3-methylbut-2-enyl diphosphate reductase [Flavobacteriales bacterium]|tara:strand:- start:5801 stop:7015 length:1215 start_codon:yes stop_codon:yes gene_type:complete
MKSFDIPTYYRSSFISDIKNKRKLTDPRKKDFTPTKLDFGPVEIIMARHFGFCYGVENAIERAYKAINENPGKRIFLLSQMIHNPIVNEDLLAHGINFIMDTEGNMFIDWEELKPEDIVIIPAFGTTLEIIEKLNKIGVNIEKYNTTCPFVEKVWKKSDKLGAENYTIIIHGKHKHEETKATFSHSKKSAPSIIIKDIEEAKILGKAIEGNLTIKEFEQIFSGRYSDEFSFPEDLQKIGVVNQTTMLANETQAIAEYLKSVIQQKFGDDWKAHFADTRDTLCYATNDNQQSTMALLEEQADLAIVVGGYNSSNTTHLVELCEKKFPTYFINSANEIEENGRINHFDYQAKKRVKTNEFLPQKPKVKIVLTSGASCPDAIVDDVLDKLLSFYPETKSKEEVLAEV